MFDRLNYVSNDFGDRPNDRRTCHRGKAQTNMRRDRWQGDILHPRFILQIGLNILCQPLIESSDLICIALSETREKSKEVATR